MIIFIPGTYQTWADAFRGVPELKDVEKLYQELKAKGVEFPMTDLDSMAPIHTPARVSAWSELGTESFSQTVEFLFLLHV